MLYLETADNQVQAYDAVTGEEFWSYIADAGLFQPVLRPAGARRRRGLWQGLCRPAGRPCRGAGCAHRQAGLEDRAMPMPCPSRPISIPSPWRRSVYNGLVLVGNAGAEWPTRGFLEALDAKTGKLVWRFNTTAAPDQPGGKTWEGDSWKYGGGSVWDAPAIDAKNDLILFATGNPNPDLDGASRKGDNAYTDSIVAIDCRPASCAGGISRCRTTSGTMTPARRWCCSTRWTNTARPCRRRPKPARSAMSSSSIA